MQLLNIASVLLCLGAVRAAPASEELDSRATLPKANEYKSGDWLVLSTFG